MNKNIYLLLCLILTGGWFRASALDSPPVFVNGHSQNLTVCENSAATSINSMLAISDPDAGQTETWSVIANALHGTLYASVATYSSGAAVTTPSGTSYMPTTGYSGLDSFKVRVTDGTYSDTTTIHVLVNPIPGPITGTATVCLDMTTQLADGGPGAWSTTSGNATVDASTGVVTGVATGNATITYTFPTGCYTTRVATINVIPAAIAGSMSVCSGLDAELTDGGGGTWSSGNTAVVSVNTSTGYYTGVTAGRAPITYTLPDGCQTTTIITINQTPPAISGAAYVCQGLTTNLTDPISGGSWITSNASIASINASGAVTGYAAGAVYITYTLGSCQTTQTFTVTPVAPILGAGALCAGQSLTLTNAVAGGIWSSAISGVATVSNSGLVEAVAPGTAVISYETHAGCYTSATVTVNAVPLPIYGAANICAGGTASLSDADGGGTWVSSNSRLATVDITSGTVTGVFEGTPIITYTVLGGCSTTVTMTVSPVPVPISGTMSVCSGFLAELNDGVPTGAWSSDNTSVATINPSSGYYTGVTGGTATISYTLPGGCSTSIVVTINNTPAPIGGPAAICLSAEVLLSETLPGGTWSSSNPYVATISSGGLVSSAAAGDITITYALGSCSVTKNLLINAEAPISSGVTTICNGATTTLTNTIGGGMWSSGSPSVATISPAGLVFSVSPGTTVITYALSTGCYTTATVVVNLVPGAIEGPDNVCIGSTIPLSDPNSGGTWISSDAAEATIDNITGLATGRVTGVPVITYMMPTGCYVTAQVTVNPLPATIRGPLNVCAGYATGITDASGGGAWSSNNTIIATANPATGYISGITAGTSVITYTLPIGCITTAVFTVNPQPSPISGPTAVCQGDSILLTDAVAGGTWTTSSTLIRLNALTAAVTGETPGLASIIYNLGGCTVSTVVDVQPITPILGTFYACSGHSNTLADLTPGGVWTSGNTSVASITPVTGYVTGASPGSVTITYTLSTGCSAIAVFTVNATPSPIVSVPLICLDSTTTVTDGLPGGTWSISEPSIATINSSTGALASFGTGVVVVTYTTSAGCEVTTRIAIDPPPDPISGPSAVCVGIISGLSDVSGGAWSSSDNSTAVVNNSSGYVTGISAGDVVITYTLGNCYSIKNITIDPLPAPITGDTVMCASYSTTLSDTGGGSWTTSFETVAYIGSATGVVTGHATGTATITYTLPVTGCWTTQEVVVQACPVEVPQVNNAENDLKIYPNPNNGAFQISGSLNLNGATDVAISVVNMLGQELYTGKAIVIDGNMDKEIQTGNLPDGVYMANLRWGGESRTLRFVVSR